MASPAKGIYDILAAASLFTGWTAEVGALPDKDQAVGIIDSGGRTPEVNLSIDYPTIQFLILGSKGASGYPDAWAKAEAIRAALLGIPAANASFPQLTSCVQVGHIIYLGKTDSDRPKFSMNFQLITEPEPVGYRESL